jgi:hypothetical protein
MDKGEWKGGTDIQIKMGGRQRGRKNEGERKR